ncbi:hypothetical protein KDA82_20040, partial [Streptomyces daliensis]|nr:hypothetical protein [Streptomyces daliensis]
MTASRHSGAGVGTAEATSSARARREAVMAVPREAFLGAAVFRPVGGRWEPVHRVGVGEAEWTRMVHSDRTWVTQIDGLDAADAVGPVDGSPTSSATLPSLVVRTAQVAGLREGDKVLEVGTGTGYSTALLCHRLGTGNVVSIEYDPGLAASAACTPSRRDERPRSPPGRG